MHCTAQKTYTRQFNHQGLWPAFYKYMIMDFSILITAHGNQISREATRHTPKKGTDDEKQPHNMPNLLPATQQAISLRAKWRGN